VKSALIVDKVEDYSEGEDVSEFAVKLDDLTL